MCLYVELKVGTVLLGREHFRHVYVRLWLACAVLLTTLKHKHPCFILLTMLQLNHPYFSVTDNW